MSVSAQEINYMIWRYFQESGLEVSAYALEDETTINKLDAQYSKLVPLGCLVDLIQKGILYSKMKSLVDSANADSLSQDEIINMNFNFFTALDEINKNEPTENREINSFDSIGDLKDEINKNIKDISETKEIVKIKNENENENENVNESEEGDKKTEQSEDFIKVINESMSYESSYSVSFSPIDSSLIAWSQRNNQSIIYSFENNSKLSLPLPISCKETLIISWSPDGNLIITASENGELHLWSATDGSLKSVLAMHHWPIVSLNWSPNGKFLLSLDIRNNAIIWDIKQKSVIVYLDKESWSSKSSDLNSLFNNLNNNLNNSEINLKNFGTDACWLDDNKFITPGPNFTLLVNQIDENLNHTIVGVLIGHEDLIVSIKYNSKLRLLCSASEDGIIRIYKGNSTNSLQILTGHSLSVSSIDWIKLKDNYYILSTSLDGTIRIWNIFNNIVLALACVDEGQAILTSSTYQLTDKILLAAGDSSGCISIWTIQIDEENIISIRQNGLFQHDIDVAENGKSGYISQISWNHDGTKLAASYNIGKSVIIDIKESI